MPATDIPQASQGARPRWGVLGLIALLHAAALVGLARVFAPGFVADAVAAATSFAAVTLTPSPEPRSDPDETSDSGAAGAEGQRATPREVAAPEAPLPRPRPAPRAASTGVADVSGGGEAGTGAGAGGEGEGTGSGDEGVGPGGGERALELISGRIDDARDYPTPPGGRDLRRGHDVVIELTVGPDGRVSACRVTDPSPDPEADAITCRLAAERFVFRPRLDPAGQPVAGRYRWRQRWF